MYDMNVIIYLEQIFIMFGIIIACILVTVYGLSGMLKDHISYITNLFKRTEKKENSGAKFG